MTEIPTKFCVNCKHLLGKRFTESTEGWRCYHPTNIERMDVNLVTGNTVPKYKVVDIYQMRGTNGACGKSGRLYEEYVPPQFNNSYHNPNTPEEVRPTTRPRASSIALGDI